MEETKMTVEQVKAAANEQISILYQKLQEANLANTFKRLDYLFKVVENAHAFNEEVVTKCVAEIEDLMTVPETEEETGDKPEE